MQVFALTDVEGSTRLWQHDPNWQRRHDAIVAEAVRVNGGELLLERGEGDSSLSAFTDAADALGAARDMQLGLWPSIRVRVALHAGDVEGIEVNRCARLRSLAHGGQVVATAAVIDVLRELPAGMTLLDLGAHSLRDFDEAQQVFQVCHPHLPADFDPLTPPRNVSHVAAIADAVLRDVRKLRADAPSLSVSGVIELRDDERPEFLRDVQSAIAALADRYAATGNATPFRIAFICHPTTGDDADA